MYPIEEICTVVHGKFLLHHDNDPVAQLVYDSRRIQQASAAVFFALVTAHNNGHKYITEAYRKGVRNFIVSDPAAAQDCEGSNVILVDDTLVALQALAAFHRRHFSIPVVGITGSNGKTIVKEWLNQLLGDQYRIARSPKSFNSQIGVPLSVWALHKEHTLALFEAGISSPGEMDSLARMIAPTIGILTNIGEAHDAFFVSREEKIAEKLKLFRDADVLILPAHLRSSYTGGAKLITWGENATDAVCIRSVLRTGGGTRIQAVYEGADAEIFIPFTDDASIQNAISCWCLLLYLKADPQLTREHFAALHSVDMRLQLAHSINDCLVVNDSYSADITSLRIALDFMRQQGSGLRRCVILSEFAESGKGDRELYGEIIDLLKLHKVSKVIAIGEKLSEAVRNGFTEDVTVQTYLSTDDFIREFRGSQFYREIILVKGARRFGFERIAKLFEKRLHETVLEINLNALAHNLKEYRKWLSPETKIMAMVKAFSYGSGGAEIAGVLQYHHINYLGVAYADEGVDLVKAGIALPVMVMNTEASSFQAITDHQLQPVLYSFEVMKAFEDYLSRQGLSAYPVHIEIETGMNRLGFPLAETEALAAHIAGSEFFSVQSVFSHLAASEDPQQDAFTLQQAHALRDAVSIIKKFINDPFLTHIANSAAIVRHPGLQMDMVRLGIGMYGIEPDAAHVLDLQAVATLRSTIAQLKAIRKGESVSYNRRGVVQRDSRIATVRIGYADGYSRRFGNGVGKMLVGGTLVPVIGTVCMDMTMIDVTDVPQVQEGDEVLVFGSGLPVQQLADWIGTIPYEIMTGVSQRVKRIYFHE